MISEKLREAVADYVAEFPLDTHVRRISNWTWVGLRNRTKQSRLARKNHTKQCRTHQCLLCEGCRVCGDPPVDSNSRLYGRCWSCYMNYVHSCNPRPISRIRPSVNDTGALTLSDDELDAILAPIHAESLNRIIPDTSCDCFFSNCRHNDTSDPRR